MFAALNIVNGNVRSGAEKQERLTKEGKDVMMGEEFAAPLDWSSSCFLAEWSGALRNQSDGGINLDPNQP